MRFWDSSALLPLIVTQPASPLVESWLRADDEVVIWSLTPVELSSALWRLVRDRALSEAQAMSAEQMVEDIARRAHCVIDVQGVQGLARRLLRLHPLRAGDAQQLAAALIWAEQRPEHMFFHALDQRLSDAARREGFSTQESVKRAAALPR